MSINLNAIITYGNAQFKVVKIATSNDVEDKFDLNNDWCYIYPNNGTKANPANVSNNSSYIMDNPFPGYYVHCIPEVFHNNEWIKLPWVSAYVDSYGWVGYGISVVQDINENINIITGSMSLYVNSQPNNKLSGTIYHYGYGDPTILPCRIKVWKIGKISD